MIKAVLLLSLSAACLGDGGSQSAYAAPTGGGYDTPTGGYDAPTGGYDAGYDQGGYDAPSGYDQGGYDDGGGYGAVADDGGKDIGAQIGELLPLFIAVFAAIILANLLAPLLSGLFGMLSMLVVGILPMGVTVKGSLINLILNPFQLSLCAIGTPVLGIAVPGASQATPVLFPTKRKRSFNSRELHDAVGIFGFDVSEDQIDIISNFVTDAFTALSSGEE